MVNEHSDSERGNPLLPNKLQKEHFSIRQGRKEGSKYYT